MSGYIRVSPAGKKTPLKFSVGDQAPPEEEKNM
jgi:hypothetical protein